MQLLKWKLWAKVGKLFFLLKKEYSLSLCIVVFIINISWQRALRIGVQLPLLNYFALQLTRCEFCMCTRVDYLTNNVPHPQTTSLSGYRLSTPDSGQNIKCCLSWAIYVALQCPYRSHNNIDCIPHKDIRHQLMAHPICLWRFTTKFVLFEANKGRRNSVCCWGGRGESSLLVRL